VTVRSTSEWFADWLDETLAPHSIPHLQPDEFDFSVVAPDPGPPGTRPMHILYGSGVACLTRTLNVMDLGRTVLRAMDAGLLQDRTDAIYVDAGLVWRNGSLALVESNVIGFLLSSGGRRVEKAGLRLGADVLQAIDIETGMLIPRVPEIDIPADTYDRLARVTTTRNRFERPLIEEPTRPDVICSNSWMEESVRRLSRAQGLARLAEQSLNVVALGQRALDALTRTVTESLCCEIQTDEVENVVKALLLATSGEPLPGPSVDSPRNASPDR
jgi:hypothetical protein